MSVTPEDIAVALGEAAPSPDSAEWAQWSMFIADAEMLIETRRLQVDPDLVLDEIKRDYVVRQAVVSHVQHPDDATQVVVAVDDASTSRTYRSGAGRVRILDEWWALLGLTNSGDGAFSVIPTPSQEYHPLTTRPDLWFQWVHPTPPPPQEWGP